MVFAVFLILGVCGHILFFMSPPRLLKWCAFFTRWWARATCLIFNIQIQIEGSTRVRPGSLIVANHVGSPDVFILGACFKGFFVSKSEIADWLLFSWLAKLGRTIFADRNKRHQVKTVIREIEARLNGNHSVILFPEARATDGTDVAPFKSAVFEAAFLANRPVIPVAIRYHDGHRPTVAYYGNSFLKHIFALLKTPRLRATITVMKEIPPGMDRQNLAAKSHRAIREKIMSDGRQSA